MSKKAGLKVKRIIYTVRWDCVFLYTLSKVARDHVCGFLKRRRIRSSIKQGRVRSVLRKEHWKFDPTWQVLEDKKFPVCDISNDYQQSTSHKAGRKDVLINYNILQKPLRFGNAWPFWHWMGCSISLGRALNQDSRLCHKKSNTNCFNWENVSGHSWHTSCKEK